MTNANFILLLSLFFSLYVLSLIELFSFEREKYETKKILNVIYINGLIEFIG